MSKPVLAVDWDGTCVEAVYPFQGDWLPGAVDALKELQKKFQVYIWTARIAPVVYEKWHIDLPKAKVQAEVAYIRGMLDKERLHRVVIWERNFKLPAELYIDDKGVHFDGDWSDTLATVSKRTGVKIRGIAR